MDDNAENTVVLDSTGISNGVANTNTNNLSELGKIKRSFNLLYGGTNRIFSVPCVTENGVGNEMTVAIFCKVSVQQSSPVYGGLCCEYTGLTNKWPNWYLAHIDSSRRIVFCIIYDSVGHSSSIKIDGGIDGFYSDGNWHLVIGRYKRNEAGTRCRIRVDNIEGNYDRYNDTDVSIYQLSRNCIYGGQNWNGTGQYASPFKEGHIDHLILWNRALTDDEMDQLWNGGVGNELLSNIAILEGGRILRGVKRGILRGV